MNKSYRSVWNESLGAWVAASEITSARGKKSKSGRAALALAALTLGASGALAQSTIGTFSPDPSAYLTLGEPTGADRGLLLSRVALTDALTWGLAGATPVEGMVVYNTTASTGAGGLQQGLAVWKGGKWTSVDETPYLHVNSTVVGNSTLANSGAIGGNSVAIGPDAKAAGASSVAIGEGAYASSPRTIAIGRNAGILRPGQDRDARRRRSLQGRERGGRELPPYRREQRLEPDWRCGSEPGRCRGHGWRRVGFQLN
ncbi:MAG: hypothetical protein EOP80_11175 [Variovorax sp.]|nr:MAG: hypothetical protein EOP80_11175 [Variovorax sp.]